MNTYTDTTVNSHLNDESDDRSTCLQVQVVVVDSHPPTPFSSTTTTTSNDTTTSTSTSSSHQSKMTSLHQILLQWNQQQNINPHLPPPNAPNTAPFQPPQDASLIPMYISMMMTMNNYTMSFLSSDSTSNNHHYSMNHINDMNRTESIIRLSIPEATSTSSSSSLPYIWKLLLHHNEQDIRIATELWKNDTTRSMTQQRHQERLLMLHYGLYLAQTRISIVPPCNKTTTRRTMHAFMCFRILVLPLLLLLSKPIPNESLERQEEEDTVVVVTNEFQNNNHQEISFINTIFDTILINHKVPSPPIHHDGDDDDVVSTEDTNEEVEKEEEALLVQWIQSCLEAILVPIQSTPPPQSKKPIPMITIDTWQRSCCRLRRLVIYIRTHTVTTATIHTKPVSWILLNAMGTIVQSALGMVREWNHQTLSSSSWSVPLSKLLVPLVTDILPLFSEMIVEINSSPVTTATTTASSSSVPSIHNLMISNTEHQHSYHSTTEAVACISKIWNMIMDSYKNEVTTDDDDDDSCLFVKITPMTSVMTSILCSILPSIISILPPEQTIYHIANNENVSMLWTLIQRCLRCGLLYHVDHRGRRRRQTTLGHTANSTTVSNSIDSSNGRNTNINNSNNVDTIRIHQLHRRRGIYLLRVIVDYCHGTLPEPPTKKPSIAGHGTNPNANANDSHHQNANIVIWRKFVSCFEMIEMESEQHLIDQVWETITELFEHMMMTKTDASASPNTSHNATNQKIPVLTWDWMKLLLGRIWISQDSPILRKLSLFRLLKGQAGIQVDFDVTTGDSDETESVPKKQSSKHKKSNTSKSYKSQSMYRRGIPLTVITVDFLFTVILSSFDTLMSSVGTNMQATAAVLANQGGGGTSNGLAVSEDMIPLLCNFVSQYLRQLLHTSSGSDETSIRNLDPLEEFFRRLWSPDIVDGVHHKITVNIFGTIADTLRQRNRETHGRTVPIHDDMLHMISTSFQLAFSDGSMVATYKDSLLQSLATMLENSAGIGHYTPLAVLDVLALFPIQMLQCQQTEYDEESGATNQYSVIVSLSNWLKNGVAFAVNSVTEVSATLATAFVDGMLQSNSMYETTDWNPKSGCSLREQNLAKAIVVCCILSHREDNRTMAGELLWPAIHKGLSHVPALTAGRNWIKADRASRALLLLDFGVYFRVLSGLGNGDLVVDKRTQQMLPPPQNIDLLLGAGATFILYHIKSVVGVKPVESDIDQSELPSQATRSSDARILSTTFARLVEQLQSLSGGFPSSLVIGKIVDDTLQSTASSLNGNENSSRALDIVLIFATLTSNGNIQNLKALLLANTILRSQFDEAAQTVSNVQALRSIFQFSKWGALASILAKISTDADLDASSLETSAFLEELFAIAAISVESTPSTALVPLFNCVVAAAKLRFATAANVKAKRESNDYHQFDKVIQSLFSLIDACDSNSDSIGMIDQLCSLIFQPELMIEEYKRFQEQPDDDTPIRNAFRRIVKISGTERPHISRIVVSRICASWLRAKDIGSTAIPYRDDIVQLLVHKEDLVHVTSLFTYEGDPTNKNEIELAANTNETSISRGFLLVFCSKLPDVGSNLSPTVQTELIQHIIMRLMDLVTRPPTSGSGLIMYGTPEYCVKIRALQALCILSRFVTMDIVDHVCTGLFEAMGKQTSHNQIRYFLEIFTLRFARMHAATFIRAFLEQIRRTDLSLQMIASLMIVSGNLIVGRYKDDFFQQYNLRKDAVDSGGKINLHSIIAGVVPWLSSTQGFSRAIAQLLAHKLIPLVVDVANPPASDIEDGQWYLRSLFRFLDENPEMKRLRKKQEHFFERYEVDSVCTPEGLFAMPVDEGQEANPVHMIEVIKECLQEVYDDANIDRAPLWRQIEVATSADCTQKGSPLGNTGDDDGDVNFQRKIIPIDELNLAMDDIRDQKHRNRMGRRKQNLIVCATLIDKVPNLGGLARTSEIFAAHKLIVPDIQITKMDNFKNLCVGAGDWIDIEECKEQNLLTWLRQRRDEGYHIVGLEQTSSSESLLEYQFPPSATFMSGDVNNTGGTVLLLGKEKEGIPIEFLQMVDQCIEIPQYGIIRSLNVHVSGAIAIWEYTKQQQQRKNLHKM